MYEENRRFSWTSLFIKIIIVIIFILFTVWLLSLSTKGMSNSLNVLTDNIFAENIDKMKNVGKEYFTTERLPKKVGEVKSLSLQKMYDSKLLLELKDKNGKKCSAKNSYVSVEKLENEYQMKVYLECGEESDYVIVIMGCYNYCKTDICEKKEVEEEPISSKTIEYQYSKTTGGSWGPWGSWTDWSNVSVSKNNYRDVETKIVTEEYSYDKEVTDTKYTGEAACEDVKGYKLVSDNNGVCTYSKVATDKQEPMCPELEGYKNTGKNGTTCTYKATTTRTGSVNCPTVSGYKNTGNDGTTCTYNATTTRTGTVNCPTVSGYKNTGNDGITCNYETTTTRTGSVDCPTVSGYDSNGNNGTTCNYSRTVPSTTDYEYVYYGSGAGSYVPGDNDTFHYEQTSADYGYRCNGSCSMQWYFTYTIYAKRYKTVTQTTTRTGTVTCPTVSGYKNTGNDGTTCNYKATTTRTGSVTCPTVSGYKNNGNDGTTCNYKATTTRTGTVNCPTVSGYKNTGNDGTTCSYEAKTTKSAVCDTDHGYNMCGDSCVRTATITITKASICSDGEYMKSGKCYRYTTRTVTETGTKNITYYRYRLRSYTGGVTDYKWSSSNNDKSLINAGYKLTGKTREVGGNVNGK